MEIQTYREDGSLDLNTRPLKRRKFYRKRGEDEDQIPDNSESKPLTIQELITHHGHNQILEAESKPVSAAEVLRQRKAAPRRRGGIEFTAAVNVRNALELSLESSDATTEKEDHTTLEIKTVVDRFAPQTGQVADVNKHMMAYIDSELAKRRQGHDEFSPNGHGGSGDGNLSVNGSLIDAGLNRQPAALGRLLEIDLGPDATLRNIARTEAAKRRLEGGEEVEAEEKLGGKVRLRRDGKPWRGRRRRNSEDMKRDKLVEEVMRESRLEIYDEPDLPPGPDSQEAADDRIAEQFRRDFLDAISSRRQRTSHAAKMAKAKAQGLKVEERPKGPKLGGSRSARAAMREMQEREGKKK